MLQREMFDIIKLKSDIYNQRLKVENSITSQEILDHQLQKIKDGLIDLPFEERGQDIITQFRANFKKLTQFIDNIDSSMNEFKL